MYWLYSLLAIGVLAWALRFAWRTRTHPAQILVRQAANMNWIACGVVKKDGFRNVHLSRENEEVVIWFKTANITLIRPHCPITFDNFIELERWLAIEEKSEEPANEEAASDEALYYREVEKFVTKQGYFEELLEVQGTDEEFCTASMRVLKAGYSAGESPKVVAMLTLEALVRYSKNREVSLEFLAEFEKQFQLN